MRRRKVLALGGWTAAWLAARSMAQPVALGADNPFDAEGYRRTRYRAPVDRDPAPASMVTLDRALALRPGRGALFLDVLPAEGAQRDPVTGSWLGVPAHDTIPGARWYPEVGRASPDPALWAGLLQAVHHWRTRHPEAPVVVFCRADCWMSWNAARRLAQAGVPGVVWFAEGIDGWHDRGRPLVPAMPVILRPAQPGERPKV